jgi:hypothetical protein
MEGNGGLGRVRSRVGIGVEQGSWDHVLAALSGEPHQRLIVFTAANPACNVAVAGDYAASERIMVLCRGAIYFQRRKSTSLNAMNCKKFPFQHL